MAQLDLKSSTDRRASSSRLISICLGVGATLTSLFITVIAGAERGSTPAEKCVWVATGVVILLAAHLLPALSKGAGIAVKCTVLPIWLGALLATGYTHATFFLNAQGKVGEQRAIAVAQTSAGASLPNVPVTRSRTQIATDVAGTRRSLALLDARRCTADCGAATARRTALTARLEALKIEDGEAVRAERASDARAAAMERHRMAQDEARQDPFVAKLASAVRLGADQVSLVVAIVLGWLVDAVAVISWASVARSQRQEEAREYSQGRTLDAVPHRSVELPPRPEVIVRAAANEPLLSGPGTAIAGLAVDELTEAAGVSAIDEWRGEAAVDLADLAEAIRAGQTKATLPAIRAFLGCADGAAMALRRRLAEEHPDLFRPNARAG
ncbi:hypothetical protein BLA39750_01329 [Burkholderia lata]|uniref:Uncharacterized protein n=1 Tax=Burkholderia lata (strain ATCC 17760 / DSM 23089 / LMG 22485 / NCIMB 9086 / R18194 / 383) TaxID=482957 RepID=A0A6P2VTH4_BURL3|nr:hypothetical protein [Burkholderia lata]VWC82792.1 hypothetical protein BLA39750_01329 [Burkholderia lata]